MRRRRRDHSGRHRAGMAKQMARHRDRVLVPGTWPAGRLEAPARSDHARMVGRNVAPAVRLSGICCGTPPYAASRISDGAWDHKCSARHVSDVDRPGERIVHPCSHDWFQLSVARRISMPVRASPPQAPPKDHQRALTPSLAHHPQPHVGNRQPDQEITDYPRPASPEEPGILIGR